MSDYSKSAVRTITPIVVGYVVALLIKLGAHVSSTDVTTVLGPVIAAVYYLVVRGLELKFPKLGLLLGVPAKVQYDVKAAVVTAAEEVAPAVEQAAAAELTKVASPEVTAVATETVATVAKAVAKKAPATKSTATTSKKTTK